MGEETAIKPEQFVFYGNESWIYKESIRWKQSLAQSTHKLYMEGHHIIPLAVQPSFNHISESALARKLGLLQYSLNRSVSTGSVKLSVFLRALSLMGYTLEIKKEGKTVVSIRPDDYSPAERDK